MNVLAVVQVQPKGSVRAVKLYLYMFCTVCSKIVSALLFHSYVLNFSGYLSYGIKAQWLEHIFYNVKAPDI